MKKIILFFAVASMLSFAACRNKNTSEASSAEMSAIDAQGGEKFEEFYDKFLTDSLFQVSRIIFPLQGRPKFVDSLSHKDEFYYSADTWEMHKKIDLSDTQKFNRKFTDSGFGVIKEIIEMKEGKDVLFIERRYRQDNKQWFLMFYGNLNLRNPEAMNAQ